MLQIELNEKEFSYIWFLVGHEEPLGEWTMTLYEKLEHIRMSSGANVRASHEMLDNLKKEGRL